MRKSIIFARKKTFAAIFIWIGVLIVSFALQPPDYEWSPVLDIYAQPLPYMNLESIYMLSPNDGWTVGSTWSEGIILRWDGENWRTVSTAAQKLISINMRSADDGWAVGERGIILRWNGSNWSQVQAPTTNTLNRVYTLSSTESWAVGRGGTILRWNGENWLQVGCPTAKDLNSIFMLSSSDGWVVGADGVIVRWNGENWSETPSPTTNNLTSVYMLSSAEGWTVGYSGTILRWDGTAWVTVESPLLAYLKKDYGISSDLMEVRMLSPTEGWAVGKNGVTLRWDGWAWLGMAYPLLGEVGSVYMLSPTSGWATFSDGLMKWGQTQERGVPSELFILFWIFVLVLLGRDIISKRGSKDGLGVPPITFGLIVINIVIFKLVGSSIFAVSDYGLRPEAILQMRNLHTILTSMFMHADYSHLVGNLFFLLIFGQIVERGHRSLRFLALYLLAGIAASALEISFDSSSLVPAIGSSGAIAGVLGACAVGFPMAKMGLSILSLLILPIFALFLPSYFMLAALLIILALVLQFPGKKFPVFPFLFTWAFYQLGMGVTLLAGRASQIGYWAHVGGFVGGMFLYYLLKKKETNEVKEPRIPPIG